MTAFDRPASRWRGALMQYGAATAIWLGLGLSLGWYYTFTWYGRTGWPMPLFEACAALVFYYFSVYESVSTKVQAVHWMIAFPAMGFLWSAILCATAPYFRGSRPAFGRAALGIASSVIPFVLAAPWLTLVGARTPNGLDWQHMLDVALRHRTIPAWPSLTPTFLVLGFLALACQLWVHRSLFSVTGARAWMHYTLSAIALIALACIAGVLLHVPLEFLFAAN